MYSDIVFHAQKQPNSFTSALRSQICWLSFGDEANLFQRWHPLRPIMTFWNSREILSFVSKEMDKRFLSNLFRSKPATQARSKPIVDLALDKYVSERKGSDDGETSMDATFKDAAICQIRTFISLDMTPRPVLYVLLSSSLNTSRDP